MTSEKEILSKPISTLDLDTGVKRAANANGFQTLNELLQHHTAELEQLPGFNQQVIIDYVSFLEARSLGYLIDP